MLANILIALSLLLLLGLGVAALFLAGDKQKSASHEKPGEASDDEK